MTLYSAPSAICRLGLLNSCMCVMLLKHYGNVALQIHPRGTTQQLTSHDIIIPLQNWVECCHSMDTACGATRSTLSSCMIATNTVHFADVSHHSPPDRGALNAGWLWIWSSSTAKARLQRLPWHPPSTPMSNENCSHLSSRAHRSHPLSLQHRPPFWLHQASSMCPSLFNNLSCLLSM